MAILGILTWENKKYTLEEFSAHCHQPYTLCHPVGNPSPMTYTITIVVKAYEDGPLWEWMFGNFLVSGTFAFYKADGIHKFNSIEFKDAVCTRLKKHFECNKGMWLTLEIFEPYRPPVQERVQPPITIIQQEKKPTK